MKRFCRYFFIVAFIATYLPVVAQKKYNVLFIAVDGLRPSALSCFGNSYAVTPNTALLAKKSVIFENAFCQQASCAPSRASLMTGLRPDTLKINSGNVHFRSVVPTVVTMPQLFKQNGYYTRAIGLVSHAHPAQPDDVSWSVPEQLLDIPKRDEYLLPSNRVRGFINRMEKGTATEGAEAPDNAYQDGQVAQLAIETLSQNKGNPFFIAVGFKRPHLPYTVPKKYWDIYDRKTIPVPADTAFPNCTPEQAALRYAWSDDDGEMRAYTDMPKKGPLSPEKIREVIHGYYASVSYVDQQIGRLMQALDSLGLAKNTIIVLWADHGIHLGERGLWGKNDLTDDATRIPLIISVPGMNKAGQKTSALVETVDVYPTLTDLCGITAPGPLHGLSMASLLEDPARKWKEAVFSRYPRSGQKVMGYSVRTANYRYNEYIEVATGKVLDREFYDAIRDPLQYENLIKEKTKEQLISRHKLILDKGWQNVPVN
ncbi:MAG: sulfatase [Bacteroidota bacterium]